MIHSKIMTTPTILKFLTDKLTSIEPNFRKSKCEQFIREARLRVRMNRMRTRYAISYDRSMRSPGEIWKPLGNTIIGFDDNNLPMLVARGVPEVYQVSSERLNEVLFKKSKVEEVVMGTVCWLYYDGERGNERWLVGTKRMVDASTAMIRSETKTLRECFSDCLLSSSHHVTENEGKFFNSLSEDCTYGFVLYHHDLHLYSLSNEMCGLRHISTFNKCGELVEVDIGVMKPKVLIPEALVERREAVKQLCITSSSSTSSFGSDMKPEMMGFIIRVTDSVFPFNVVVKSPLYRFIEGYINDVSSVRSIVTDAYFKPLSIQRTFVHIFNGLESHFKTVENNFRMFSNILYHKLFLRDSEEDRDILMLLGRIRKNKIYIRDVVTMMKTLRLMGEGDEKILNILKMRCL